MAVPPLAIVRTFYTKSLVCLSVFASQYHRVIGWFFSPPVGLGFFLFVLIFFAQFRKIQLKALSSLKSVLVTVTEGNGSRCPSFVHYCCNPQRFHVCFVKPYGLVATWGPRDAHLAPRVMLIRGLWARRHPQDHSRENKQFPVSFPVGFVQFETWRLCP